MDPKLASILTVFVIGLVAFFIGYFLTSSSKTRKLTTLEKENNKLKQEQNAANESSEMRKKKIETLRTDLDICTKEKNEAKQANAKLADENRRLENVSYSPTGKLYKQEYEAIYEQYIAEMDKRKELEKEKFTLLKASANSSNFSSSNSSTTDNLTSKINLVLAKVGFGNNTQKDDLTKIEGLNLAIQDQLNEIGIYQFKQIAQLQPQDLDIFDGAVPNFSTQALKHNWIEKANNLA